MSAPDTNISKQVRRHSGSLIGIGLAFAFAITLASWIIIDYKTSRGADGNEAVGAASQ
ncbi:MAG: hypothetical protein AAF748_06390 [Pseudomonadota bacterium]